MWTPQLQAALEMRLPLCATPEASSRKSAMLKPAALTPRALFPVAQDRSLAAGHLHKIVANGKKDGSG